MIENVTYRWLKNQELNILEPVLASRGWASLNPNTSIAIAAFDDGKLAGFLVLQHFPHCEPLFVESNYRGTGIAETLVDHMYAFVKDINIRGFMVVADSPHAAKLCESRGMRKIESPVYIA